ncbi:MAG: SH3 domain-containing protein [Firmicutes bacterium]|nr:SH3 domain-containing protein [Bacillota bacterium]
MIKTKQKISLILVFLLLMMVLPPGEVSAAAVSRIGGADRYQTAVDISKKGWSSAEMVVLARGDQYADALAGVPLAAWYEAPILLTRSDALPSSTLKEIERLNATKAIILGEATAISAAVESKLKDKGLTVERIGGKNRYSTAALIAKKLNMPDVVYLAYGQDFPDALAAAPYAGARGYPILLTNTERLPAETEAYLKKAGTVYVVGGEMVISDKVLNYISQDLGKHALRFAGADRYGTATELAVQFNDRPADMYGATGREFPDAITGAVLAAGKETGILLVGKSVPETVESYIYDYGVKSLTLFGEEEAISGAVAASLNKIISGPAPAPVPPLAPHLKNYPYATMVLSTPANSKVTAKLLREKANACSSGTPLADLAEVYLEAQERWGVNALYLMAHSALESGWGRSPLARDKNNIYGFKAYDRDPYGCGSTFKSKADCINYVSAYIRLAYLNGDGIYYYGPHLYGMNHKYATDKDWHKKIADIMERFLPSGEGKVSKTYHKGRVTASPTLNLRRGPGTRGEVIGSLSQGTIVDIQGLKLLVDSGGWYRVKTALGEGWVSSDYISLEGPIPGTVFFIDWYQDKDVSLNVRSGPGTSHSEKGKLSFGQRLNIVDVKVADEMIWYQVTYGGSSGDCWVSGDKYVIPHW